jgi:hypothetical protein
MSYETVPDVDGFFVSWCMLPLPKEVHVTIKIPVKLLLARASPVHHRSAHNSKITAKPFNTSYKRRYHVWRFTSGSMYRKTSLMHVALEREEKRFSPLPHLWTERDLRYRCVELPPQKFTFKNCLYRNYKTGPKNRLWGIRKVAQELDHPIGIFKVLGPHPDLLAIDFFCLNLSL